VAELTPALRREKPILVNPEHACGLYNALLTIIRQNAQGVPIGHDAIVAGRSMLAIASTRTGQRIDWAREKKADGVDVDND
jgi:hypothetical protein